MRELSIFIDESGDFGEYSAHSPYYIITMVFHNQSVDISADISKLDKELEYLGLNNVCIHTGPIIRKEEIYKNMDISDRRKVFNKMVAFIRQLDIKYKSLRNISLATSGISKRTTLNTSKRKNGFNRFKTG